MKWAVWAVVLVLQAGSSTWASRARNTGSLGYHAVAATGSHGIWFMSSVFMLDTVVGAARGGDWGLVVRTGIFYTAFTVLGSVLAHWAAMKIETGKRKVGA